MTVFLLSLLVSSAWAVQLPVGSDGGINSGVMDKARSGCEYPFVPVGSGCVFFSEEIRNFEGAQKACESLGSYHVNLATFDMNENEDEALLQAAASKNKMFWVGGSTEDGEQWQWVDQRPIDLQAPILDFIEPNEAQNKCLIAQIATGGSGNNQRAYLYDYSCDESLNFICQTGCPTEFHNIDQNCYFFSEEEGLPHLTWQEAQDYCVSISVPVGYHADLAVLGLDGQDNYRLINKLNAGNSYISSWLGAMHEDGCDYKWNDGRSLSPLSHYWPSDLGYPKCGSDFRVYLINYSNSHTERTYLIDTPGTSSLAFICQMFKD